MEGPCLRLSVGGIGIEVFVISFMQSACPIIITGVGCIAVPLSSKVILAIDVSSIHLPDIFLPQLHFLFRDRPLP